MQREGFFFALLPDDDVAEDMVAFAEAIRQQYGIGAKPIPVERLHLTLAPVVSLDVEPGKPPDMWIEYARHIGRSILGSTFDVTLDQILTYNPGKDRHAIVLESGTPPKALTTLRRTFYDFLKLQPDSFSPHVTLFWDNQVVPRKPLAQPLTWRVRDFALIQSFYGKGRHERLDIWPLTFT